MLSRYRYYVSLAASALVLLSSVATSSLAQVVESESTSGKQAVTGIRPASAIVGEPFGVFTVELPLPASSTEELPRILVDDSEGRVYYPATSIRMAEVRDAPPLGAGGNLLGNRAAGNERPRLGRPGGLLDRIRTAVRENAPTKSVPVAIQISGLFLGDQPLEIRLSGDVSQGVSLTPIQAASQYRSTLESWWTSYGEMSRRETSGKDSPKLIHQYLCSTLSRRLGLPGIDLDPPEDGEQPEESKPLETLALLGAIEPLREEVLGDVLHNPPSGPSNLPVPEAPAWPPTPVLPIDPQVQIESLATRVPPECFYLRFGAFSNFVWFQEIAERYGGDIAQAVLIRGFTYDATARIERMLAAKMTSLAKMFGDSLIGDLAVVGTDMYMTEGASLGVIFQARNPALLGAAIEADRKAAASKTPGAQVQTVVIAGREVIQLSSPDNKLRSFYVADGKYVMVTTSRRLIERFLEVGDGARSMADSTHFQSVRSWMPDANNYAVFAYFSPEFFQHLVSPQYQIELRRRLQAIAHLEIADLASLAAKSEGVSGESIGALEQAGLVPNWFDQRADGAQVLKLNDQWIDSQRGGRGSFAPIGDVPIHSVTAQEADAYRQTSEFYRNTWKNMDPLVIGLRRFQAENSIAETVTLEGYIAPFEAEKYGWIARQLGEPTSRAITLPTDDVAQVQLHVRDSALMKTGGYHLFGGVKDMYPPEDAKGFFEILSALQNTPAYIGAWPKPGLVDRIPLGIGKALAQPDYAGFSRMIGGLWRWQDGAYSVLSFSKPILENAIPQLSAVETNDVAQARLNVANPSETQIANWINDVWYRRSWKASVANAVLLDTVHQQLKVPSEKCLATTNRILDVRLQCPLGGEYVFQKVPAGNGGWWVSDAWSQRQLNGAGKEVSPDGYAAPWIEWFRGGTLHATQRTESLALVGQIELEMEPLPIDFRDSLPTQLPNMNFDIFSLPGKIFGAGASSGDNTGRRKF